MGPAPATPAMVRTLSDGLRERGYLEGQNLSIDVRWLLDENPNVATELAGSGVDLIVAWATPAAVAATGQLRQFPSSCISVADPVGLGIVAELARPGGNITGMSNMSPDIKSQARATAH